MTKLSVNDRAIIDLAINYLNDSTPDSPNTVEEAIAWATNDGVMEAYKMTQEEFDEMVERLKSHIVGVPAQFSE